ncbi:hypothetical protein ACIBAC_00385 [Streptomyces sp. NPDC051362]|uniref:hypothetical protein n=1 Tax=Streptomyces sp. NPDC051362 TaxID=3365651 RepID=UPI00379E31A1
MSSFNLDEREKRREFASYFKDLEDRIANLERSNQLNNASIEGSTLDIYDEEGTLKGSVGVQDDGTVALVPDPVNTDPPPTPSPPTVDSALAGLDITWSGQWADAETALNDFALVQVHVGAAADFTPTAATQVSQINDVTGGKTTVHVEGFAPVWVRLVAVNTAALTGDPSEAVQGQARQAVSQDLIDGIVTDVKLAENAVTAAKIALGAVGTTALADGAVLEDKLAKAAVTLGKIATGAVTINALGGALSDSAAQRYVDTMNDPAAWTVTEKGTGAAWSLVSGVTDAPTSQNVGRATGYNRLLGNTTIPYEPGALYRLSARVRLKTGTSETFYVGVAGIGADGTTLVNRAGVAGSATSHYYIAASGRTITQADGWVTVVGFVKDRAAAGSAGPNNDPRSPGVMHNDVRFIAPYVWLNYNGLGVTSSDVMEVDFVSLEALKTGIVDSINITAGAVNAAAIAADAVVAGKIAADAISARELQANSVTAQELSAGSVTALAVAAGSITADKLTIVGSPNVLPDPSFEGAGGAAVAAKQTYLSQDKTFGNGSTASLKTDAVSVTAAYRAAELTLLPVTAGDQIYIATDYYPSTDWAGGEINMQIRWEKADGTILSYTKATTTAPVRGAWARLSTTGTAPTDAVLARVRVESGLATAGSVWWDNAAVRPVLPGVQIADGAITAPKIFAGAVTTSKLDALAVTAEKIAALAITTDKLAALSITADKMAVNSVTATAIAAGVIDATHIKAGAITADRLAIVGGNNMLPDPSFEGAGGAALVAGQTFWSIVNSGNGSAKSAQVNAVNATAVIRTLLLAAFPILPGQQLRIATDVNPSTDWNGSSVRIYARWIDSAGAVTFGFVTNTTPTKGAWQNIAGVVTAPAGTVTVEIRLATYDSSAGTVQFDNTVIQPVLGQVQIADGAITADKLDAAAINGKVITGATVQTAATGKRIILAPDGTVYFYSGDPTETAPAKLTADGGSYPSLSLEGPRRTGSSVGTAITMFTTPDGTAQYAIGQLRIEMLASGYYQMSLYDGRFDCDVIDANKITSGNVKDGRVTITPSAPNTPTSVTVTGLNLTGSNPRAIATPATTVPGTQVTGVGCTDTSTSSVTIWVTRTNTTNTTIDYTVRAS